MKMLILLPVLMATISLNGMSRFMQSARQLAPTLRSQLSAQAGRLPATMPGTCPAGMRLLSSSSRSQGGYNYAGGKQQAAFGGREATLLLGAALAGKTVYDYWNTAEGRKLKYAYAAPRIEEIGASPLLIDAIDEAVDKKTKIDIIREYATNGKLRAIMLNPRERIQFIEIWKKNPELRNETSETIVSIFLNAPQGYDMPLLKAIYSQDEPISSSESQFRNAFALKIAYKLSDSFLPRATTLKNESLFEQAWKILIDNSPQEIRERIVRNFSNIIVIENINHEDEESFLTRIQRRSWYIKQVDLYLDFLQYIVEKYPESMEDEHQTVYAIDRVKYRLLVSRQTQRIEEILKAYETYRSHNRS